MSGVITSGGITTNFQSLSGFQVMNPSGIQPPGNGLQIVPTQGVGFYNTTSTAPFVYVLVEGDFFATGHFDVAAVNEPNLAPQQDARFNNAGILARDPFGDNWVALEIGRQFNTIGYLFKSTQCGATNRNTQQDGVRTGDLFLCRSGGSFEAWVRPGGCADWVGVAAPLTATNLASVLQVGVVASAWESMVAADNRTTVTHFEIGRHTGTCRTALPTQ